jgi:uroporphyrinogen decarboxylase
VTGRERVLAAFAHVEPDRVPLDLASTAASAIEPEAAAALRRHLALPAADDHDALDALLDVLAPDLGRVPLGRGGGTTLWQGRKVAAQADLDRIAWPDADDPRWCAELRGRARHQLERGRAVVLDTEIGVVDGCQRLRGTTGWLEDLLAAPAFADDLIERVTSVCVELVRAALRVVGDLVDAVVLYEDIAGQRATLVSPDLYRARIKRHHARLVEAVRDGSQARAVIHCDGAVSALLRDFTDIGVDALNPVQTSAAGMDARRLKREVGRSLCLWGGCDTPAALAFGTPEQVRVDARQALRVLAPGGGYVFGPVHPIAPSIPPANVLALVEAVRGDAVG